MEPWQVREKTDKEISATLAEMKRLRDISMDVSKAQAQTTERLTELKAELPKLLTGRALGQVTDDEVKAAKQAIREIERELPDFPLTLNGLAEIILQTETRLREPRRVLKKLNRYHAICKALEEDPKNYMDIQIAKSLAKALGIEDTAESFLSGLPQMQG